MKKLLMIGVVSVLLIATLLTGCNGSKTNTTISDTESATVTTESTEEAVKDILTYVKGKTSDEVSDDNTEVTIKPSSGNTDSTSDKADNTADNSSNDAPASEPAKTDNDNSSNDTQPAKTESTQHTHSWVAVTETVTVTDSPATTRQELVTPEWWEWVTDKTYKDLYCEQHNMTYAQFEAQFPGDDISLTQIIYDGYMPTSSDDLVDYIMTYVDKHPDYNDGLLGWTSVQADEEVEGHEVHHDATYKTVAVPAVTHTEERVVGYRCDCGATK